MANQETCVDNEPLIGGFSILRAVQLLNIDVYYLGLISKSSDLDAGRLNRLGDVEAASKLQQINESSLAQTRDSQPSVQAMSSISPRKAYYSTFIDDLAAYNPIQKYIDRFRLLNAFCNLLKICTSLAAIMFGLKKTISNIILCLLYRIEPKEGTRGTNNSVGLFVLILVNLSSIYILFSTIFNGHLIWNLLSQRLFLVSRRFQYKTMLFLLVFIYLEYIINITFINNLYDWDYVSNNIQSGSYSVLANLRIFLTEQDKEHYLIDTLLTILQFARGIIRISPYIINLYTIICIEKHIDTIRNQRLLIESLKKRQKLQLVVKKGKNTNGIEQKSVLNKKKRVIFVTSSDWSQNHKMSTSLSVNSNSKDLVDDPIDSRGSLQISKDKRISYGNMLSSLKPITETINHIDGEPLSWLHANGNSEIMSTSGKQRLAIQHNNLDKNNLTKAELDMTLYSTKIGDFDELESYITNLYIFTDRFNRVMSKQGLTTFFMVHNLVISVSLIVPEAIQGGSILVYLIRILVIVIGIMPFLYGQSLRGQLEQLSRQIDRIIIQQQFIHRRRDNLIRIRELIHDIRINCGGLLNFNVESGIKYLVVAFASAFFIEQERKLTISIFLSLFLSLSLSAKLRQTHTHTHTSRYAHLHAAACISTCC